MTAKRPSLHPLEAHALTVGEPGRDIAAGQAGLALRHFFLRAAQRFPPGRPVRRPWQGGIDDFLDLVEAQDEFGPSLLFQIITQRVVVVHLDARLYLSRLDRAFTLTRSETKARIGAASATDC